LINRQVGRKNGNTTNAYKDQRKQVFVDSKGPARLLEIEDESILNLTIEESSKGQRLVYAIQERSSNAIEN